MAIAYQTASSLQYRRVLSGRVMTIIHWRVYKNVQKAYTMIELGLCGALGALRFVIAVD
jgi:hypothetical protein